MLPQDSVIAAQNLTKQYAKGVYGNIEVNLEVGKGEIFGLLGPNGSGKTTFVKQVLGLLSPTEGTLLVLGEKPGKSFSLRQKVNYLSQNPYALWHLNVEEAVSCTARLKGSARTEAMAKTRALLQEFDLWKIKAKLLGELSGGTLRLVNLCQALIHHGELLVLDEPTAGLDPVNKQRVWQKILSLGKENVTVLLVTHDVAEAEKVLSRVGFIHHARVIALGTPSELKRDLKQNIKLQVVFKNPVSVQSIEGKIKNTAWDIVSINDRGFILSLSHDMLVQAIENVTKTFTMHDIEDISMTTPTLEDVFIQLSGEKVSFVSPS